MKTFYILFFLICIYSNSFSQTPGFYVKFRLEEIMYHGDTCNSKYTISLERCKFDEAEIKYTNDTSKLDWKNLSEDIIQKLKCNELDNRISNSYVYNYDFRNHDYPFESIIKINIFREKYHKLDTMIISFPIKISSFVTFVDFKTLYFYPGKYDLTDNMIYSFDSDSYLNISPGVNILPK